MISRRLCAARPRVRFPRRFNAIMFVSASPAEASTACLDRSAVDGLDFGERPVTAPHAPWQNPFVERFVGSARRECFDHVIAFNEAGVRKLMRHYCSYYEKTRTHLALDKDAPVPRPVMRPGDGDIVAIPEVGGLHHRYERRAA